MEIPKEVLRAFNLKGEAAPLPGGQNTSARVGEYVLKPVDSDPAYCEWMLGLLFAVNPQGYRISKPLRSSGGAFSYKGWCCTRYEPGEVREGDVKAKLEVSRLFHRDLKRHDFSGMPRAADPWSKGHRIAWRQEALPRSFSKQAARMLNELICNLPAQTGHPRQIVHADLSGNILFHQALEPLVIDFSPTLGPVEYAEAILVCDCVAWQGSPCSEMEWVGSSDFRLEMVIRAIVFRLAVAAMFAGEDAEGFMREYQNFRPILEYLKV